MNILKYLILVIFIHSSSSSNAQTKKIDSLVHKVNNRDIYVLLLKKVIPRVNENSSGTEIIKIGRQVTPKLIKILDDQNKGIAAHIILTEIWKNDWSQIDSSSVIHNGKEEIIIIRGLKTHVIKNDLFSTNIELTKNKIKWKKLYNA
jgi:hypothetical protein